MEPRAEELADGPPEEIAVRNAHRKAASVTPPAPGALVLGVDTVVSLDGRILGKPGDAGQARETLAALSGRRHLVTSGLCLIERGRPRTASATTAVRFRELEGRLIDWYLASGEWRGRAGGYAIQGLGAALVAGIEGDYLNVVGLPAALLLELAPALLLG